ncbi:MAG: peroxiredoxin family protein [Thermodesulfobacteriota bacterium]
MMKKIFPAIAAIGLLFLMFVSPTFAANLPPATGGRLPPIKLPVPKDPGEKKYLGLSGSGFFRVPQIKTRVVIIEIFSMYCPQCQKIAPGIEELYQLIENDVRLKDKIKLIGIGAGNSRYEVEVFKKTFNVPFPLFPDNDFTIHEALGDVRSPYFIAIRINKNGTHEVIHSELDSFKDAETFLELMIEASGLQGDYSKGVNPEKD